MNLQSGKRGETLKERLEASKVSVSYNQSKEVVCLVM
jgi:hypothetical protein